MEKKLKILLYFTIAYMIFFTILSIYKQDYPYIYYNILIGALIFIIVLYHKQMHLSNYILAGLTVLGLMHMSGSFFYIAGTRLYDFWLIPNIFKFDNLIHAFAFFIATFVVYNLLYPHLDKKIRHRSFFLCLLLVSIAMGLGAFIEIIEFGAVVFLNAANEVGDYFNNAKDLVFNLIGSLIACFFIVRHYKKKHKK